jgi:MFS transporter, DHA1 family, tetracycline resistance protein
VGVAQAYVADVTAPEDRARGMGMIGAAFGLGFIFGPAIGGLLAQFGPAAPFLGAAALAAANGVLAIFRLPESLPASRRGEAAPERPAGAFTRLATLLSRRTDPRLRTLYLVSFLTTLAFAAMEATLSLWADRRWALSPTGIALFFAYLGTVAVIAQGVLVGRLVRRVGERRAALMGLACLAAGLAAIPLAPSLPLLAVALAMFAVGQGAAMPSVSSLISRTGGAADQGRLLGVSQSVSALARVVGPAMGGVAFAHVGIGAPYLGAAVAVLAALAVLALGLPRAPAAAG